MSEQAPEGITAEDWAATPLSVRVLVQALQAQVTRLEQRVGVLEEQAADLAHVVQAALVGPTERAAAPAAAALRTPDGRTTGA